jgi:MraZ protein
MLLPSLNAELTLDPKGRVMLPVQLQRALELHGVERLVAFANGGPTRGLALFKIDDYNAMAARNQSADPMDARSRLFALAIASTAQTVSVDNAGRMLIPPQLRSLLGLDRELFLYSAGSWFEIWDMARWQQQQAQAAALWDQLYGFGSLAPTAVGG